MDSTALIPGLVTVIVAAITGLPGVLIAYAIFKKTKVAEVKTEVLLAKTDRIESLANGHLTKVTSELAMATEKIESLERLVRSIAEHSTQVKL